MNHCGNYACKLTTCACICFDCQSAKGVVTQPKPCPACGVCPTCGHSVTAPVTLYVPYSPGWYCALCMVVHPYNYVCIRYNYPTTPWIYQSTNVTYPYTWINNTTYTLPAMTNDWQLDSDLLKFQVNCNTVGADQWK